MKQALAVVLVSGGMDSCLTAAIACQKFEAAFLHLSYGQRTAGRERRAFEEIADYYNVKKRLIVDAAYFKIIGASSLTDRHIAVTPADLQSREIPSSYVPFRNGNILSIATSWAEAISARRIFIGAVEEDSSGYPDCRETFFKAFNQVITEGTKPGSNIIIDTPLIHFPKEKIVNESFRLGAPLHLTWSCYQNEEEACGVCDSCALRLRGFQRAGKEDPIRYMVRPNYL
jgi:7-cyano-7-deazaguanine synthase